MDKPSRSDWSAIYQAAVLFQRTAPWEWMDNEDLFAIENPNDGEMGYCSVLGSAGEEFGLGMFVGEDGYNQYIKLIEGETETEDIEERLMMRSISMLLASRDVLQKEDREVIRSLGLQFRGRNAWPFFRNQRPGYVPWFLEKGEVLFLTDAIHQALVVADEVLSGKLDLSEGAPEGLVLTRCYRASSWIQEWRRPPTPIQGRETNAETIDPVKEAELHLFRHQAGEHSGVWEIDIFVLPIPIGQKSDRPYYPTCFLAVERKLGLILGTNLTKSWLTLSEKQDEVIQLLKKAKHLPREIRVKSDKVKQIVEPVATILGIKLRIDSLPMLDQAKESLYNYLSGGSI